MSELELMTTFGRIASKTMQLDSIQNMFKDALIKLGPTKKFQSNYILCMLELVKSYIKDVHMVEFDPRHRGTAISALDLVKDVCVKQLQDMVEKQNQNDITSTEEFNEDLANRIINTYVNGAPVNDNHYDFVYQLQKIMEDLKYDS